MLYLYNLCLYINWAYTKIVLNLKLKQVTKLFLIIIVLRYLNLLLNLMYIFVEFKLSE